MENSPLADSLEERQTVLQPLTEANFIRHSSTINRKRKLQNDEQAERQNQTKVESKDLNNDPFFATWKTPVKESTEDQKEDSFDSFDAPVCISSSAQKRLRSSAIKLSEREQAFSTKLNAAVSNFASNGGPESGISGFPDVRDKKQILRFVVKEASHRDGCLDIECESEESFGSMIYLQDLWCETLVAKGDVIQLVGADKWGSMDYTVTAEKGIVIVNPDILVPCTSIASANWCPRKVILNDRIRFPGGGNKAMLLGAIVHELFQMGIQEYSEDVNEEWLLKTWRTQLLANFTEELVAFNFSPSQFESELQPYLEVIASWISKHIPKTANSTVLPLSSDSLAVKVVDIEETIWDPVLGIKGKVDVTIKTSSRARELQYEPLELKTGKSGHSAEHLAQVYLYSLMLSSKYDQRILPGNLLYLKDSVSRNAVPKSQELKSILQARNSLAKHMGNFDWTTLPEARRDPRFCGKCEQHMTCSFYQTEIEQGSHPTEIMQNFAIESMQHLEKAHRAYFAKWMKCVFSEWAEERKGFDASRIWRKSVQEREELLSCIGHLKITKEERFGSRYIIEFSRDSVLNEGVLCLGDICCVSTEGRPGFAMVSVFKIGGKSLLTYCDRTLSSCADVFHLDRHSSFSTYSTTLGGLLQLMSLDDKSEKLRRLIINGTPPVVVGLELEVSTEVKKILLKAKLNAEQRMAVLRALNTQDYLMIEGFPGSGKSSVIAVLVKCLIALSKSVLFTSFTHSAIDNVIAKLVKDVSSDSIVRLGKAHAMREEILSTSLEMKLKSAEKAQIYSLTKRILKETLVVACTCHHVPRDVLFSWRQFDFCIVDEASMVLEPVVLSALLTAKKFVFVGDCHQLAPLVQSKVAKNEGANVSLMQRLQEHKDTVVSLNTQYRMNRQLASLSSQLYYEGRLVCGTESVARGCLNRNGGYHIPSNLPDEWRLVLDGQLEKSCVFVDTRSDEDPAMRCDQTQGGVVNRGEARVVARICERFLRSGVDGSQVGVMCTYRKQIDVIRELLVEKSIEARPLKLVMSVLQVNTVDQYQGRDKGVIIWATTWTDSGQRRCELLRENRRLNVAVTRARHKLVVVGCRRSLESMDNFKRLSQAITDHVPIGKHLL